MNSSQSNKKLLTLTLMFASILGPILLVELSLSMTPKPKESVEHEFWKYDSQAGWTNQESVSGLYENDRLGVHSKIKINELGLRNNESGLVTNPTDSLLIVGDSVTAGFEVNDSETFSSLLEQHSQKSSNPYKVYNAGVRGYGTDQAYYRLKRYLPILKPTRVLYVFCWNDLFDNLTIKNRFRIYSKSAFALLPNGILMALNLPVEKRNRGQYDYVYYDSKIQHLTGEFQTEGTLGFLREHSRLYEMSEELYYKYVVSPPTIGGYDSISLEYTKKLFQAILQQMKTIAPDIVMTAFVTDHDAANDKFDIVSQAAKSEGIPFIDLRPFFKAGEADHIVQNDGHWNQKGHATAARGLLKYYTGKGLVRSRLLGAQR